MDNLISSRVWKSFVGLLKKESLELVRDQRSLIATFAYALVGPLLLFAVLKGMVAESESSAEVSVAVQTNAEYAAQVVLVKAMLGSKNIAVVEWNAQQAKLFIEQQPVEPKADVMVQVLGKTAATGEQTFTLKVFSNNSTSAAQKKSQQALSALRSFIDDLKQQAILKQGVNPYLSDWSLQSHQINQQSASGKRLLQSLLIFMLLAPFVISLNYINDATAGERERGSLIPLLTQPLNRSQIVAAKWLVGSVLGVIGTLATMWLGFWLVSQLPIHQLGMQFYTSLKNVMLATAALLPLAILVASLQMLIALSAKSFKEGQSYLTLFSFVPMVVVFMATKFEDAAWSVFTPLIGHQQMLQSIFTEQGFNYLQFLSLTGVSIGLSLMALTQVQRQLNSEQILQGR